MVSSRLCHYHLPLLLVLFLCYTSVLKSQEKAPPSTTVANPHLDKFKFKKRRVQIYRITFASKPDATHFQLTRSATSKWPKRANLFLKIGEISVDKQIKLESYTEKQITNKAGIVVDASYLTVTHLPTNNRYTLTRKLALDIPTYFAEFTDPNNKRLFVKQGDQLEVPNDKVHVYQVTKVEEDSVIITYGKPTKSSGSNESDALKNLQNTKSIKIKTRSN